MLGTCVFLLFILLVQCCWTHMLCKSSREYLLEQCCWTHMLCKSSREYILLSHMHRQYYFSRSYSVYKSRLRPLMGTDEFIVLSLLKGGYPLEVACDQQIHSEFCYHFVFCYFEHSHDIAIRRFLSSSIRALSWARWVEITSNFFFLSWPSGSSHF